MTTGTKRDPGYFISEAVPPTATCAPLGDVTSVYSPLSPLAPWSLSVPQTGTNRGVDFSGVTAVQIEFRGSKVAPSPRSDAALGDYCQERGEDLPSTIVQRVVSDVNFVAGRRCPRGAQLVGGNLNAGVPQSRPVYMCVDTAPAAMAPEVVSELVLVHNNTNMQQTRCPRNFDKAGVDLNLGGLQEAPCTALMGRGRTGRGEGGSGSTLPVN